MSIIKRYKLFTYFPIFLLFCLVSSTAISQSLEPYYVARIGTKGDDRFQNIWLDSSGNYYIHATFELDTVMLGGPKLVLPDSNRNFIVKYNTNNQVQWVKTASNFMSDWTIPTMTDGFYSISTLTYDSTHAGPFPNSIVLDDTLIKFKCPVKFYNLISWHDTNINLKWVIPIYGNKDADQRIWNISPTKTGDVYICGTFKDSLFIDTSLIIGKPDEYSSFIVRIDTTGRVKWLTISDIAQRYSKTSSAPHIEYVVAGSDDVFISGVYYADLTFGNTTILNPDSSRNQYLAKLDSNGNPLFIRKIIANFKGFSPQFIVGIDGLIYCYTEFTADSLVGDAPFMIYDSAMYSYKDADCLIVKIGLDGKMKRMVRFGGNGEDVIWGNIDNSRFGFTALCKLTDSFSLGNSYQWVGKYPELSRTCVVGIDTNLNFIGISDILPYTLAPGYYVVENNGNLIFSFPVHGVISLNGKSYGNLNPKDSSKSDVLIVRSKPNFHYLHTRQVYNQTIEQASFPNPTSLQTRLTFSLPTPSPVTITLHDILGREVLRRELGVQSEGEHEETLNVSELPIGSYIVKISTNQEVFTSRISVVR